MRTAGIISEYNPFHRGHAWQIDALRAQLGADTAVVCAMSGHWVQRGECALTDKWTRAGMALRGGADLVLELPTPWATSSAESFARGGVGILVAAGVVDTLSFGSEGGDTAPLYRAAACLGSEEYRTALRRFLDKGLPFAACRQAAVEELLGREAALCLSRPNDNLAVEYLRALPERMGALAVRRVGAEHDGAPVGGYASASAIRGWLHCGKIQRAEAYLPEPWTDLQVQWCLSVFSIYPRTHLWSWPAHFSSWEGRPFSAGRCLRRFLAFFPWLQLLFKDIFKKFLYDLSRPLLHIASGVGIGVQGESSPCISQDAE